MSTTVDTRFKKIVGTESASARSRWLKIGSYAILGFFSIFYIWPLFMLINTSLRPFTEYLQDPGGLASEPSLANFSEAWELANFPQYMLNSALYTTTATAIFIATSLFVAFPIARGYFKGSKALLTMYVVALFLPPALIPQFQLILNLGLFNTRPGFILLFLVIFPLIRPAVATVTVLHAIGIWNELILPTIYLTDPAKYPITRGLIVFEGVYGNNWPGIAAAVLMLMIPILVLFMFLQRYIIGGLTAGAVKG